MLRGGNSVHARLSLLSPDIVGAKMREIKFRAWDMRVKKMYFGGMDKFNSIAPFVNALENYPLMQYTGLKDKNGKEIYEGDIVIADDDGQEFPEKYDEDKDEYIPCGKYEVYWAEAMWWLRSPAEPHGLQMEYNPFTDDADFEVIGNIYENPELVK